MATAKAATTFEVTRGMVLRTKKVLKTNDEDAAARVEIPAGTRVVGIKALEKGGLRVKVYDRSANHGKDIDTAFGNVTKSEKGRPATEGGAKPAAKKTAKKKAAKKAPKVVAADIPETNEELVDEFEDGATE